MTCPKCQYQRQEHDSAVMPGVCPSCGIAYDKYVRAMGRQQREVMRTEMTRRMAAGIPEPANAMSADIQALDETTLAEIAGHDDPPQPLWMRVYHYACFMPSDRHESAFWGHLLLYAGFTIWGWHFILGGIDWNNIGGSFLHNANLAFHEYGHLMFSPLGTWWMFLGGSLFQILLPLFPLAAFMVQQRDNFAASIMLWWCGQNFIDVSPYIQDAPARLIPLTTGNEETHDWWNLLSMSGNLERADSYAALCFSIGVLVILLSNAWGGYLLWIEFQGRTQPGFDPLDD